MALLKAAGVIVVTAVMAPACQPQTATLPPACTVPQSRGVATGGATLDFIVSSIAVDPNSSVRETHTGFDLDGLVSGERDEDGCEHGDFRSATDPRENRGCCRTGVDGGTCTGGVDNQLPAVLNSVRSALGMDPRAAASERIADGRLLMAVRLSGVDDLTDDPDVAITVMYVFDSDSDCANNRTTDARFIADDASFFDGDPARPRWQSDGFIAEGRFRTRTPFVATLRLPIGTDLDTLETRASRWAFDVLAAGAGGTNGNFGGWVPGQALVDTLLPVVACCPQYRSIVLDVVGDLSDIRVDGVCDLGSGVDAGARRFGGVSMGYGFELARVAPIVDHAARPGDGVCGGSARADAGVADAQPIAVDASIGDR